MKKIFKNLFNSEKFKKAMVHILYTNPRLTTAEYIELNNILRNKKENCDEGMQIKKAS